MSSDDAKKLYMMHLVGLFKDYVSDAMNDGHHEEFEDHMDFLAACMTTFIDDMAEEEIKTETPK
jgi:hypothetical protein